MARQRLPVPWSIMLKVHAKAPTLPLPRSYSQLKRHRLTDIADIEAHSCIADLATRAACCRYLPLTATRSEKEPAMASPSSLPGEGAKGHASSRLRNEECHPPLAVKPSARDVTALLHQRDQQPLQ